MDVLVLGGTAWLGGLVAQAALQRGHAVTCLARGSSGPVPEGAALVRADRTQPSAYDAVAGRRWDLVVDVSRQPGQVRTAVAALGARTAGWVMVSTGSVYAAHREPGQDERAALLAPLEGDELTDMALYGQAKVACEQHVLRGVGPDRAPIARAGLLGGPGDVSDRTGYWPWRFSSPTGPDGAVLVPDAPSEAVQVLDARDLAAWLVEAGLRGLVGTYGATGSTTDLAHWLELSQAAAGHTGPVVAAPPAWLRGQGVEPFMGPRSLPMWLGDPDRAGFSARDSSRGRAAGLHPRPLEQTVADTLAWERSRPQPEPRQAGLPGDLERELLARLRRRPAAAVGGPA